MSHADHGYVHGLRPHGLPDPNYDWQFYRGVPMRRLLAWVIDLVAVMVMATVLTVLIAVPTLGFGLLLLPPIGLLTGFVYRTVTIGNRSATWGMRLMGIELRNRDGDRLTLGEAALHTGIFLVCMASVIGWLATCLLIAGTRYGQGIPDMVLGSTAINRPID
jgi:uncharacterized RDD family membrane protein YckC